MNIKLMKEKEDLQKEFDMKYQPINEFREKRAANCINDVKNTFVEFFKSQGFSITNKTDDICATYKNIEIVLSKPDKQEPRIGYSLFFTLLVNNNNYSIPVIYQSSKKRRSIGSHSYIAASPDEKLDKEIKYLKEDIAALPEYFESIKSEEPYFGYYISKNDKVKYEYRTFSELLESIFNS